MDRLPWNLMELIYPVFMVILLGCAAIGTNNTFISVCLIIVFFLEILNIIFRTWSLFRKSWTYNRCNTRNGFLQEKLHSKLYSGPYGLYSLGYSSILSIFDQPKCLIFTLVLDVLIFITSGFNSCSRNLPTCSFSWLYVPLSCSLYNK